MSVLSCFYGLGFLVLIACIWFKLDEIKSLVRLNNSEIESLEYGLRDLVNNIVAISKQLKQTGERNES